ncbi:MAG TPA: extracellular solute-binding protein [Acidimicrobiales bacterium]|nr:extracellular solute-binding protein [Acidimicrobiales bacterium]
MIHRRTGTMALAITLLASVTGACGGGGSGVPTLNWYINPDNGGQAELAAKCSAQSNGAYRIKTSVLPNDATGQREQLVRRLAAKDASIDLMSLDPPFIPEFAEAGFLRPYTEAEARELTAGALTGPIESGTWDGKLMGAPFWANTQLLWFRKSVAQAAGIDPARDPVTWSRLIEVASAAGKTVEVQGNLYEGYMVLISALVSSAGGRILENPEAGKNVRPAIDSDAGRKAAAVIQQLARSRAANPALSTTDEEAGRSAFQGAQGGYMVNWAYIYGAAQEAVAAGTLDRAVLDDIGWGRYPRVDANSPSRPPLGGINMGIGAFSNHQDHALQAVRCITSQESQTEYMLKSKNPAARAAVYDNAEVRAVFPMADDLRSSLAEGAPRPRTPYYTDVSTAVQRSFHPPASVDPSRTPARAAKLIVDVLKDKVLL